ncbi:hypothetical protein N665_0505s0016 [Sinapis alba]|nr:hypothetical protein N665_0505s0016 [Sinapis alba]
MELYYYYFLFLFCIISFYHIFAKASKQLERLNNCRNKNHDQSFGRGDINKERQVNANKKAMQGARTRTTLLRRDLERADPKQANLISRSNT